MRLGLGGWALALALGLLAGSRARAADAGEIRPRVAHAEIVLDAAGDGKGAELRGPRAMATDAAGNLYVAGYFSHNVFKRTPEGEVSLILDGSGDGAAPLRRPSALALDAAGNLYVAGDESSNVFRVSPKGEVTLLFGSDSRRGPRLVRPLGIGVDAEGNVFVCGRGSHNVIRISPDGTARQIIGRKGDRKGHELVRPNALTVDAAGNAFVAGARSNNVFRISPDGKIVQLVDELGPGRERGLHYPNGLGTDAAGNLYVTGNNSANLLRVTPDGEVEELVGPRFAGRRLTAMSGLDVRPDGGVFFARMGNWSAWRWTPGGGLTPLLSAEGLGEGRRVRVARGIRSDPAGHVYLAGFGSHNVFMLVPPPLEEGETGGAGGEPDAGVPSPK